MLQPTASNGSSKSAAAAAIPGSGLGRADDRYAIVVKPYAAGTSMFTSLCQMA